MKLADFDAELLASRLLEHNAILVSKISSSLGCDEDEVPVALREVLRFLYLVSQHPTGMLTPSHRVDLAWHEFILCTRAYSAFCEKHLGRFIHHYPGGLEAENRRQFHKTLRLYRQQFGIPNRSYWDDGNGLEASCGACEAI